MVKPFWEGYIQYNSKRIGVYKIDVVECLLRETFIVNLEGSILNSSVQNFPGSLTINKVLNVCHESNNPIIAKMGYKQRQLLIYNQIKRDLWDLFLPSNITEASNDYKTGEWTTVKPSKTDKEYDFNLAYGLLHYEDIKYVKGTTTIIHRIANLKEKDSLPKLMKLVLELKKHGKNTESFCDFDFQSQWNNGFNGETFESKYILNNTTQQ
jgi:hypothetical protein